MKTRRGDRTAAERDGLCDPAQVENPAAQDSLFCDDAHL